VNGFTVTRTFDAPRERVWREWTEPGAFADWFGGPEGHVPLDTMTMDVRPGGSWQLTMHHSGREIHWMGDYVEVEPPARLVFTITDQPGDAQRDVCTLDLTDLGDGRTKMRFEQRGGMTPEQYQAAKHGWAGFFDRIAERLAAPR
jgi:uncharacterized protein YndB with AHSA1/START domain